MNRLWGSLTVLLALAFVGVQAHAAEPLKIGERGGRFTLKVINKDVVGSGYVSIDSFFDAKKGQPKKAVLLSFFATYCKPCAKELPHLVDLYNHYKDSGLQVIVVSIDQDPKDVEILGNLAKENAVPFPVLTDRFNIVARRYNVAKLPCMYLVDSGRTIRNVQVGYTGQMPKDLLANIRSELALGAGSAVPPFKVGGASPGHAPLDTATEAIEKEKVKKAKKKVRKSKKKVKRSKRKLKKAKKKKKYKKKARKAKKRRKKRKKKKNDAGASD